MALKVSEEVKFHLAAAMAVLFEDNENVPTFEVVRAAQDSLIEAVADELRK